MTLKEYRKKKGYTQVQIAKHLNINQNSYSRKENGLRQFTVDELVILGEVFEIPISEVVGLIKG